MERRRRLAANLGLLALLIVDVVLVLAALRVSGGTAAVEPQVDSSPVSTPSTTASATPTTDPSSPTTSDPGPTVKAPGATPLTVSINAINDRIAWRSTIGSCGSGGATVQLTTDGGRTWRNRTAPFAVITRLQPSDGSKAFAVGASVSCDLAVRATSDGGGSWPVTANLATILARDPRDPATVRAPGGRSVTPCDARPVVDLARNSTNGAQSLCGDGSLRSSSDDGQSWTASAQVEGALALDSRLIGNTVTAFVASTTADCQGITVSAVSDGKKTALGCATSGSPPAPGTVALSAPNEASGWLLVGTDTWRSSDGLKTWAKL